MILERGYAGPVLDQGVMAGLFQIALKLVA
jgi:hypothetical protein